MGAGVIPLTSAGAAPEECKVKANRAYTVHAVTLRTNGRGFGRVILRPKGQPATTSAIILVEGALWQGHDRLSWTGRQPIDEEEELVGQVYGSTTADLITLAYWIERREVAK